MLLNLQNVEELVFMDKRACLSLPEFQHLFDSWNLGTRMPALRNLARRSVLDFLNNLQPDHLAKLSEYFQRPVSVDKIDYHIVKNLELTLEDAVKELNNSGEGFLDLAIYRQEDCLYVSLWK